MSGFADRADAGRLLADRLADLAGRPGLVVFGLPRGGVAVAAQVASRLGVPLDVVVSRKLGVPGHPELAMGAVAVWDEHETCVAKAEVIAHARVTDEAFAEQRERQLAIARERATRWNRVAPAEVREVVLVDDGLATGATMEAAVQLVRDAGVGSIVVAVPVAAPSQLAAIRRLADRVECVHAPEQFRAVGMHYADFRQVEDEAVDRALRRSQRDGSA